QPSTISSSLTANGTPPKGLVTSALAAARLAPSASMWQIALYGSASADSMTVSTASAGVSSPARNASTSEQASPSQGVLTPAPLTDRPSRKSPAHRRSSVRHARQQQRQQERSGGREPPWRGR